MDLDNIIVKYIRKNDGQFLSVDPKDTGLNVYFKAKGSPKGTLVGFKTEDGNVRIGWSMYNSEEEIPFSKKIGKELAIEKSKENIFFYKNHYHTKCSKTIPYFISKEIPSFIDRCKRFFKTDVISNLHYKES